MKFFASCSKYCRCIAFYTAVVSLVLPVPSNAANVKIEKSVLVAESHSDNVAQEVDSKAESENIIQIKPHVKLDVSGPRSDFLLNYDLDKRIYQNHTSSDVTQQTYSLKSVSEVLRNEFFLDVTASQRQYDYNKENTIALDNLNAANQKDLAIYGISPRFVKDLGGALLSTSYTYNKLDYEESIEEATSDSAEHSTLFNLKSSSRLSGLTWEMVAKYQYQDKEVTNDEKRRSGHSDLGYIFANNFSVDGRVGYENNDVIGDAAVNENNGSYVALGISWFPNEKFRMSVLDGKNFRSASVLAKPNRRISLRVLWVDTELGFDKGVTTQGELEFNSKRTSLLLRYSENTTNKQRVALATDRKDVTVTQPAVTSLSDLSDNPYIEKRAQLSLKKSTTFTTTTVTGYHVNNEYLEHRNVNDVDSEVTGGEVNITWNISALSKFTLERNYRDDVFEDHQKDNARSERKIAIEKRTRRNLIAELSVRQIKRDIKREQVLRVENMISISLQKSF